MAVDQTKPYHTFITALTYLGIAFALICCNFSVCAQNFTLKDQLLKITAVSDSLTHTKPAEKLYLQFDKPYYAIGDTIWFKAYLLNATYFTASDNSGIMYIDIANDSNKVIKQNRLPVAAGLTWGNIDLDEKEFAAGTYTIRAYTNWMRNLGDDYFFYKSFYVGSTNENNLLVTTRFNLSNGNANDVLNAKMLFSDMNEMPFAVKPLQLEVMNGGRHLYKQKLQTGVDGALDINFNIPQKSAGLAIVAETEQKDKKVIIPVTLRRDENIDLQFLPEGGNLVAGLPAHIGFKAISEDGRGVNVSGIVTDHEQKQVAEFKPLHSGMGSFDLAIKEGESYTAKATLPGGAIKEYPLPVIKASGMVLQVKNRLESDSLQILVLATGDIAKSNARVFLIGKARGIVCYAAVIGFHDENFINMKIPKTAFPTGIVHFTLMTLDQRQLNERLVFINQHDDLNIQLITDKQAYGPRDSVSLKIKVTDNTGQPVEGNFSLSVTDDSQVKTDSLNGPNMLSSLLLTSDLKGYVEEPGYYLSSINNEKQQALDNLLLTQGWVGYDWQQVFHPGMPAYEAEHEFTVKGRVSSVFNKPLRGTDVILFSRSPAILMDTVTDKNGRFVFQHFPRVDTPVFLVKAVNKNGKSFNVGIDMDDVPPPVFTKPAGPAMLPWYVNSDTTMLNYTKSNSLAKQQQNFPSHTRILKEVKISAKKIVTGSQNLNGPGNADIVLNEKDLEKAGKKTFLQLLEDNVSGFGEMNSKYIPQWYYVHFKHVVVLVDGIFLHDIYVPFDFITLKSYLQAHDAEDLKGIEVMSSSKFALAYASRLTLNMDDYVFVEFTTRSGHGPIIGNTPGMYLYKPLPLSWPEQFYKPKYSVKDAIKHLPDLRSTIDWEPNITTSIAGTARVFFYTADKPATYTLIIEGADMSGNIGYRSGKIKVK